jgi:hypothetical protein
MLLEGAQEKRVFMKLRHFGLILAAQAAALAADPGLLRMVMPDAKVVAGIQVAKTRDSQFGQYVLSHMQVDDEGFRKFVATTGLDPLHDLSEILIASNWQSSSPESRWLVMAHGTFDLHKIGHAATVNGARVSSFQGVDVYAYSEKDKPEVENGIAFTDATTALLGDVSSVKAAIGRWKKDAPPDSALLAKVHDVSAQNDFWFVTLVPVSEFAAAMPDPGLSSAMQGNLLAGITQASGGVRFGDTVAFSAQAVARSDKDAQALVDVVKFVAGMVQLNRQENPTAGQVATLLDALDCKATGNVTTISLAIPETQLEQMLQAMQQPRHQARKRAPAPVN